MNNEIKVSLSVTIQGRVMVSQQVAENKPEFTSEFSMEVADAKGKNKQRIFVKGIRKTVPAKQQLNINVDAYEAMISNECPYWKKKGEWEAMPEKERLEAHLWRIAQGLGGSAISYEVFED